MKKILAKIKLWYQGYVDFQDHINDPDHPRIIITEHPHSSLRTLIIFTYNFWLRHWKYIITTIIAISVLIVMILDFISKS